MKAIESLAMEPGVVTWLVSTEGGWGLMGQTALDSTFLEVWGFHTQTSCVVAAKDRVGWAGRVGFCFWSPVLQLGPHLHLGKLITSEHDFLCLKSFDFCHRHWE